MPAYNKIQIVENDRKKEYSREEITNFAREAKTQSQLASLLGVHRHTIANMMETDPIFCTCVTAGFHEANKPVIEALYKQAQKGDTGAIKYILGNRERMDWVEKHQVDTNVSISDMTKVLDELDSDRSTDKG